MASTKLVPNAIIPEFLTYKNYEQWSLRVKTYLLAENLWEVVNPTTGSTPQPEDGKKYKAWTRKNAKALHIIQNSCGTDMFSVIGKTCEAERAWVALENECKAKQKAQNDAKEFKRYIPFRDCVDAGDWQKAKECLKELPDAVTVRDPRNGNGDTALHVAAKAGHSLIVKDLVSLMSKEDVSIKNANGSTALHVAVKMGHMDVVKQLAPLIGEVKDRYGHTVLHLAVNKQNPDIVKELVQSMKREDLEIKNNDGSTALHLAVKVGNVAILKQLLPYEDFECYIPFTNSVLEGNWDNAKDRLREIDPYKAVRARDLYGNTALHVAVKQGHVYIVNQLVLLMTQEDLEVKSADAVTGNLNVGLDEGGIIKTASHMVEQNEKMLSRVLEPKNAFGDTALHEAVTKGHLHIVKQLVPSMRQEGLEVKNNEGYTALYQAVSKKNVNIVKELVPFMRDEGFEVKNIGGFTALHKAVWNEDIDIVKELVQFMREEGFEVKNNEGLTALHLAVWKGNANIVKELVPKMRPEGIELKEAEGSNALHRAVKKGHVHIVKELVSFMKPEALEITDGEGDTAFSCAIDVLDDRVVMEIAKYMARKNNKVFGIYMPALDCIPVVWACTWNKVELGRCLYSATPLEALNGVKGADLIAVCFRRVNSLDIAWDLLQLYPRLAVDAVNCPMLELARMRYAFLSGTPLAFWQKCIYNGIHIQPPAHVNFHDNHYINVANLEDHQGMQRDVVFSGINRIYKMKSNHTRIYEFLRCMGEVTEYDDLSKAETNSIRKSIFKAIEKGNIEFVTHMCKVNPNLVDLVDENKRNIFHFAIECRQEKIYSLIYRLKKDKRNRLARLFTKFNNSMLHSVGKLSPTSQCNHIQGAALQMQRELQWFEEVEKIVPFDLHESLNHNSLTARELFTQKHKKLMEEAENSIKGTAGSCTVVGSLIATMMFAAAFTVPGGNNGDTGTPIFIDKKVFLAFIVSDILSLVFSTTSVVIFLGLLTSRYSEKDYLKSLPRKMMIGLFTLFISITTMMISFCAALIIMLHGKYSWTLVPSIVLGSVPIAAFVWVQFSLLVGTFMSTYGPGIFDKKVQPW